MTTLTLRAPEGEVRAFAQDVVLIGRGSQSDLVVADRRVSGLHGRAVRRGGAWFYQDLGSTNGSAVERGGQQLPVGHGGVPELELSAGDIILLGDAVAPVRLEVGLAAPEAADGGAEPADGGAEDGAESADAPRTLPVSRPDARRPMTERPRTPPGSLRAASTDTLVARVLPEEVLPRAEVQAGLMELLLELGRVETPTAVFDRVADWVFRALPGARRVTLLQAPADGGALRELGDAQAPGLPAIGGPGVSNAVRTRVVEERAALLFGDLPGRFGHSQSVAAAGMGSAIVAPLLDAPRGAEGAPKTGPTSPWKEPEVTGILQVLGPREPAPFTRLHAERVAVLATHLGAVFGRVTLLDRLRRAEEALSSENRRLKRRLGEPDTADLDLTQRLVGRSAGIEEVRRRIQRVAPTGTTVLLTGETGTGKEVAARAIHDLSERRSAIFAAVNCGALAENLLESELFGHVRGAFTGAVRDKRGHFQVADGGTLFLDELGELSPPLQVKLLRALQEGEVTPVGATRPIKVDVRIVCATNRDLQEDVASGRFREDLYYRVNVFGIALPPLRERAEDIPLLAAHFLDRLSAKLQRAGVTLSAEALERLSRHRFPGNARELLNEIERALLFAEPGETLGPDCWSERVQAATELADGAEAEAAARAEALAAGAAAGAPGVGPLRDVMQSYEVEVVRARLAAFDGNRTRAARSLGISRQALVLKIAKLGLK